MQLKKIITFILALAVLIPLSPVLARDGDDDYTGTSTDDRRGGETRDSDDDDDGDDSDWRRASSTERRENKIEDREERQASSTERRIDMQQNLAKRKAENTARVFTATLWRLDKIITRVESRIDKVESAGGTTTNAKIFVLEARGYLEQASTSIATFKDLTFTADKAKENFEKVRDLASEIKGYVREAHRSLMNAIRSLKGSPKSDNATTTSSGSDD